MKFILIPILIISFSGCSSLLDSTRKAVGLDDGPRVKKKGSKWVTKDQYDSLMVKYKNLLDEYNKVKESKPSTSAHNDLASEVSTDSVDVFGGKGVVASAAANKAAPQIDDVSGAISDKLVDKELSIYRKGVALVSNGKMDEALKVFLHLENSPTKQIRVRARYQVGQIYLKKQQYDLALQMFEKVITMDSFSGIVLDSLQGASFCAAKLGLEEKVSRYDSLMRDVFGLGKV